MAINFTEAAGQVRLLISDVDEANPVLSDEMITGFLARYGAEANGPVRPRGPINRAAADALDAIATSEALISKVIRTGDGLTTDGAKLADALRKQAAALRQQADKDDEDDGLTDDGFFGAVEFSPYGASNPWEAAETARTPTTTSAPGSTSGTPGVGIASVNDRGDGSFTFTLTDGAVTDPVQTIPGTDGAQGIQGVPGADGADGAQGIQGIPGEPGADGADGAQGIQGIPGEPGTDGADGAPGADGESITVTQVPASSWPPAADPNPLHWYVKVAD